LKELSLRPFVHDLFEALRCVNTKFGIVSNTEALLTAYDLDPTFSRIVGALRAHGWITGYDGRSLAHPRE